MPSDTWEQSRALILSDIQSLKSDLQNLDSKLDVKLESILARFESVRTEILGVVYKIDSERIRTLELKVEGLNTKASVCGAIFGSLVSIVGIIISKYVM